MNRSDVLVHAGIAALVAAAAVTAVTTASSSATGSGTPSVYVPIAPCRLADTRADSTVGSRATPLGTAETYTFQVWGTNGNCTIPTSATGIGTNVTAVNPTAASYLTVFPADVGRPLASNLNWVAASPPTPNQVTVGLSATGAVSAFNNGGAIDVIIDIVGYYEALPASGPGPAGPPMPPGRPSREPDQQQPDRTVALGSRPRPRRNIPDRQLPVRGRLRRHQHLGHQRQQHRIQDQPWLRHRRGTRRYVYSVR